MKTEHIKIDSTAGLQLEVWKRPITDIAADLHVTPASLEYRIRREEIIKPPPEYWAQIQRGVTRDQALKQIGWTSDMIRKVNTILQTARKKAKA